LGRFRHLAPRQWAEAFAASTKASLPYTAFCYLPGDILLLGRESAGVPTDVYESADARLVIPLKPPMRSLNVAVAAAMVAGEATRQLRLSGISHVCPEY